MSWARVTDEMRPLLREAVLGRRVWDLGAGDLSLSRAMLGWGATHVTAIDKESCSWRPLPLKLSFEETYFDEWRPPSPPDVALVSWPINRYQAGLVRLLRQAPEVLLISKNTGGTACGWPGLYRYLKMKEVLREIREPDNCLVWYGPGERQPGRLVLQEEVALQEALLSWEEAQILVSEPVDG